MVVVMGILEVVDFVGLDGRLARVLGEDYVPFTLVGLDVMDQSNIDNERGIIGLAACA